MTLQNTAKLCRIRNPRATRNQQKELLTQSTAPHVSGQALEIWTSPLLKEVSVKSPKTQHDVWSTVNLQLFLDSEGDPKRQFKIIDECLREYERRNSDWPTLAKMCNEVKVKGLWKHGGYKDWSHWVLDAAPVCAKTVFVYVSMYENLAPDFSHEELREMPPETAKKMTQVSSARRQDPAIREASKKRRREFVQTVKAVAPEQHIEDDHRKTFTFSESQWAVIEQTFIEFRQHMDSPNMSDEEIVEALCINWSQGFVRKARSWFMGDHGLEEKKQFDSIEEAK
jgi:hypothetical protein